MLMSFSHRHPLVGHKIRASGDTTSEAEFGVDLQPRGWIGRMSSGTPQTDRVVWRSWPPLPSLPRLQSPSVLLIPWPTGAIIRCMALSA